MNPFGRLWKESGKKEIVLYEPYSTFTVTWKYGHSRVVFLVLDSTWHQWDSNNILMNNQINYHMSKEQLISFNPSNYPKN